MSTLYQYADKDFFLSHSYNAQPDPKSFPQHTHTTAELHLFLAGRGVLHIEGNAYPLKPGDLHVMAPSEFHYIEIDSSEAYERIILNFNPDYFHAIDPEDQLSRAIADRNPGRLNCFSSREFHSGGSEAYFQTMLRRDGDPRVNLLAGLVPLLGELYRIHSARSSRETEANTLEYRIIRYINKNISAPLTLDDICQRYFISKSQLCRLFKKATGTTVWQYVTIKRLVAARQMLQAGQIPTRVCTECGFNDYSAFYRAYVKHFGCPPREET